MDDDVPGVVLVTPTGGRRFTVRSEAMVAVLSLATRPMDRAGLSAKVRDRLGLSELEADGLVSHLLEAGVLERVAEDADQRMELWHYYNWEVASLYHFAARGLTFADVDRANTPPMKVRQEVIEGYQRADPFPYGDDTADAQPEEIIRLPQGEDGIVWPLRPTLLKRRTLRTWTCRQLSRHDLGNLLWYGLRPMGENRAVVASDPTFSFAGSLLTHFAHLGAWVLPIRVEGLPDDVVYRYDAVGHQLVPRGHFAEARALEALCVGQVPLRDASVVVVLSARFEEFMWRYRHERAYGVLWLEVGQMMQNLILTATGMRLRPFITPALRDGDVDALLGLDGYREGAVYLSAFG
ncbi:MAG: SagB/ThcOx family dehydrogenase [Gemmatimonadaceae bacterium]